MSNFTEWWEGLSISLKIYWALAVPFSLFFILQLVWSMMGGGDVPDDTPDADIAGDTGVPFQFLTIKTPPAGRTSWTMQLLAHKLVELRAIDAISDETVRRTLKKTSSSRGRKRPGVFRA